MLVSVNDRLKFEIEIVHDLSCHPIHRRQKFRNKQQASSSEINLTNHYHLAFSDVFQPFLFEPRVTWPVEQQTILSKTVSAASKNLTRILSTLNCYVQNFLNQDAMYCKQMVVGQRLKLVPGSNSAVGLFNARF